MDALDLYSGPYEHEALLRFTLFRAEAGGRPDGIGPGVPFYSCPLMLTPHSGRDCRILLDGARIELGATYEFPVVFLSPDGVKEEITPGMEIGIWEGRKIGTATIVRFAEESAGTERRHP